MYINQKQSKKKCLSECKDSFYQFAENQPILKEPILSVGKMIENYQTIPHPQSYLKRISQSATNRSILTLESIKKQKLYVTQESKQKTFGRGPYDSPPSKFKGSPESDFQFKFDSPEKDRKDDNTPRYK